MATVGEPARAVASLTVDAQGTVREGTAAAAELFGVEARALADLALARLVGARAATAILVVPDQTEVVARRQDGVALALGVTVEPLDHGLRRLVLTDLCHAHRTGFPGVVSETVRDAIHALRNPLAAALNSLDLMTHRITRPEDVPSLQRVTRNGLDRMDRLLSHMRELVQLGVDRSQAVDLAELSRTVVAKAAARGEARGVHVTLKTVAGEVLLVDGDSEALGEALDALLSNAVDASGTGTVVTLTVARDAVRREAVVTVQDEGEGIPPERMKNVFRMFYTTRKEQGGEGVGLSRARWVVAAHGGVIDLESAPNRGTTVTLRLPL